MEGVRVIVGVWQHAREHLPDRLPVRGIGIAIPGNVDPTRGFARYLPNFGWLDPVDVSSLILDSPAEAGDRMATDDHDDERQTAVDAGFTMLPLTTSDMPEIPAPTPTTIAAIREEIASLTELVDAMESAGRPAP